MAAQIRNYKPDILFCEDPFTFDSEFRQAIRSENPAIHLETWTQARRSHAQAYHTALQGHEIITPFEIPNARHVSHLYVIRTARRDDLLAHLNQRGIEAGVHYPIALHRQPAYMKQGYARVSFPVAEQAAEQVLSLPLYPEIQEEQLRVVVGEILEVVEPVL